jgi:hypothetical protein
MGGARRKYGRDENSVQSLIAKYETKRPRRSPWYWWKSNIKIDLEDRTRKWWLNSLDSG